jgi:ABC-type uncharacterized transport system substrate-binding protein
VKRPLASCARQGHDRKAVAGGVIVRALVPAFRLIVGSAALVIVLASGLASMPSTSDAQPAKKKLRIGVLGMTPLDPTNFEMFKQGLAQHGYHEGQQVVVVQEQADNAPARLPAAAAELVRLGSDVIFARGPDAVAAAARATTTIPVVAVDLESDPIALGYAKTLGRPGGNVTGVFLDLPELSAKQLQLFREIFPGRLRIALVGDSAGNAAQMRATERAAQSLGVQVQTFEGRNPAELDAALEAAHRAGFGGVLLFSSPLVFRNGSRIATIARDKRLPTVSLFTEFAEAGGLLTYGPSLREAFRRSGIYVGKVLAGAKAGDLPIERPEKFELVINLKTAKALGVTIPPSLRLRADQIIE